MLEATDNPYDGHILAAVIDATEGLTDCTIERGYVGQDIATASFQ